MSTINQLERDQVCLCHKQSVGGWWHDGRWDEGRLAKPRHHKPDCPFFSDYSTSVSAHEAMSQERELVF